MEKKTFINASFEVILSSNQVLMGEIDPIMSGQEDFDKKTALGD